MNEFDQFMKHDLKVKHYARYTDDFVVIANSRLYLEQLLPQIQDFLRYHLALELHPHKVTIQPSHRGVDFLGYVVFPHYCLMRTKTKKRMMKKLDRKFREFENGLATVASFNHTLQSYLGVLSHANARYLQQSLKNKYWIVS